MKLPKGKLHTQTFYENVDMVVLELLNNPGWMLPKRCHHLNQMFQEKFQLNASMVSAYIKEAKKVFRGMKSKNIEEKREQAIMDREKIIRMALRQNKLQTALNAMKERDIIEGVYIERHEVTGRMNMQLGAIPVTEKALELSQSLYSEMNEASRKN
jgi:hypothetical protein